MTDLGSIISYFGIDVKNHDDGLLEIIQPYLIQNIIEYCRSHSGKQSFQLRI